MTDIRTDTFVLSEKSLYLILGKSSPRADRHGARLVLDHPLGEVIAPDMTLISRI